SRAIIEGLDGERRADGQHTSHVLANCPDEQFPAGLSVTIQTYHLDDVRETPELFDLFDNPMSARTNMDKLGVLVAGYADLADLDRGFLSHVAKGIDYYFRGLSKDGKQSVLFANRDCGLYFIDAEVRKFALWIQSWDNAKHGWMIGKPGITAEIYAD